MLGQERMRDVSLDTEPVCRGAHGPGVMSAGPGGGFKTEPGRSTDSVTIFLGGEGAAVWGLAEHSLWVLLHPPGILLT